MTKADKPVVRVCWHQGRRLWQAWYQENTALMANGSTMAEAIGNLVLNYADFSPLEVSDL